MVNHAVSMASCCVWRWSKRTGLAQTADQEQPAEQHQQRDAAVDRHSKKITPVARISTVSMKAMTTKRELADDQFHGGSA
jgi:hypothetical protein